MCKIILLFALCLSPSLTLAQSGHSPYVGREQREIKSLSPGDIQMYLQGHGMGMAKAAELNHYPGPKHVLDLAKELNRRQHGAG